MHQALAKVEATYDAQDGCDNHADVTRHSDGSKEGP